MHTAFLLCHCFEAIEQFRTMEHAGGEEHVLLKSLTFINLSGFLKFGARQLVNIHRHEWLFMEACVLYEGKVAPDPRNRSKTLQNKNKNLNVFFLFNLLLFSFLFTLKNRGIR